MKTVQIILSSVRAGRIGDQIAAHLLARAAALPDLRFEILDLRDWPLPMDDEPSQPKQTGLNGYVMAHTRAFSRKIQAADGFVLLTPQYNWGYPASLKNALDHLYDEWAGKPVVIATYGSRGGVKAAAQLREVLTGLHMHIQDTSPALFLANVPYTDSGRLADPASAFARNDAEIDAALGELSAALKVAHPV